MRPQVLRGRVGLWSPKVHCAWAGMLSESSNPLLGLLPPSTVIGLSIDTPWETVSKTLLLSAFYFDVYSTLDLEVT